MVFYNSRPPKTARMARKAWDCFVMKFPDRAPKELRHCFLDIINKGWEMTWDCDHEPSYASSAYIREQLLLISGRNGQWIEIKKRKRKS